MFFIVSNNLMVNSDLLFKAYGLTATQYDVLRVLRGAGSRGATCSVSFRRGCVTRPTIS